MSNIQYSKLKDAIANLEQANSALKFVQEGKLPNTSEVQKQGFEAIAKTAVVKCFEICCDTMWKLLKKHLEEAYDTSSIPDKPSPKDFFLLAQQMEVITENMYEQLFKYQKLRNKAAHDYEQQKAQDVLDEVENYIQDVTELYSIIAGSQ